MKTTTQIFSFIVLLALTFSVYAEEGFYLGLRAANVSVNEDEIDDLKNSPVGVKVDDAGKMALMLGYDFGKSVSVELLAGKSTHDVTYETTYADQELDLSTLGLYLTYRTEGEWFFKGKGGLLSRTVELSNGDKDSAGLISIGLGGGVNIDERLSFELEFMTIEQGISSFGVNAVYKLPR